MNDKFIGERLTELRIERDISEQKMSYELGMAKTYIWNICAHKSQPSMTAFLIICEYLNVSPAEFFEPMLTEKNYEHLKQYASLSDEDREVVDRVIHGLIADKQGKGNSSLGSVGG